MIRNPGRVEDSHKATAQFDLSRHFAQWGISDRIAISARHLRESPAQITVRDVQLQSALLVWPASGEKGQDVGLIQRVCRKRPIAHLRPICQNEQAADGKPKCLECLGDRCRNSRDGSDLFMRSGVHIMRSQIAAEHLPASPSWQWAMDGHPYGDGWRLEDPAQQMLLAGPAPSVRWPGEHQ